MIPPPASLELTGVVGTPTGGVARKAVAGGTVVDVVASSGSFVQRDDAVLAITGPEYIAAQQALIDLRAGTYQPRPRFEDIGHVAEGLRLRLQGLKFSSKQIAKISETLKIIDPVPVLANQAGLIIHGRASGQAFEADDALFLLAMDIEVRTSVKREHADFLRAGKAVKVTFADGTQVAGTFENLLSGTGGPERDARIVVAGQQRPPGEAVTVSITFEHWERLHPGATASMWPYDRAPRNGELLNVLRALGASPDQHPLAARTVKTIRPPAANANPFAAGVVLSRRPKRAASSPFNTRLLKAPKANITRASLSVGATTFGEWGISIACAAHRALAPEWHCPAQVVETGKNGDICAIVAQHDGVFQPLPWREGDLLRAGTKLGHIKTADQSELNFKTGLASKREGIDISRIEIVYADHDGVARTDCGEPRPVRAHDVITELNAINMYIFRSSMPDVEFDKLPRVVTASLSPTASTAPEYVNHSALITVQSRRNGDTEFHISFPSEAGAFKVNYGKYLMLTDESARRHVLCVPTDSIMHIGQSAEVLVHSEIGQLMPAPVTCGTKYGEYTEIISGLAEKHGVVRDLELLSQERKEIRAVMSGF